jgi:hypothetical protein
MTQPVVTPTAPHLAELLGRTKRSLIIASPFIKLESAQWLCNRLGSGIQKTCYTSLRLAALAAGSLDLDALDLFQAQKVTLWNVDRLHAKIYLRDDVEVLVTSANLTPSGLHRNLEIGILTDNKAVVQQCLHVFNDSQEKINRNDLLNLKGALEKLPQKVSVKLDTNGQPVFGDETNTILIEKFSKWKLAVWKALQEMPEEFTREELIAQKLTQIVQHSGSSGRTPEQTLSRELQELRTLGFLEFLSPGRYRRVG